MDRETAYEIILDQPKVLDSSFRFFRSRPDLFRSIVVDHNSRLVQSDSRPLRCGRTLAEIIALILRASAKRYFRRKLGHTRRPRVRSQYGIWDKLAIWAGFAEPPQPRQASKADRLFATFRDFLVYEWQALMIPVYCTLTPEFVTSLGQHILSFRDPAQLTALSQMPDHARRGLGNKPLLLDNANRLMNKGAIETINAEILYRMVQMMRLDLLFPEATRAKDTRQALSRIAATGPDALYLMMPILGHDIRQFVTFLFVAYIHLGDLAYGQVLGRESNCRRLTGWLDRITPLPPPTLKDMKAAFEEVLQSG